MFLPDRQARDQILRSQGKGQSGQHFAACKPFTVHYLITSLLHITQSDHDALILLSII